MEPNLNTPISQPINQPIDQTPPAVPISQPKPSKSYLATAIIASILAVAGIGAGVYFFMDSNNKTNEISTLNSKITNLNAQIESKDTQIAELEAKVSSSNTNNEGTETTEKDGTATITLGDIITETETGKVFKIGECSADGGTSDPNTHFSLKCQVTTNNGDSLISYHGDDTTLRLTLPND